MIVEKEQTHGLDFNFCDVEVAQNQDGTVSISGLITINGIKIQIEDPLIVQQSVTVFVAIDGSLTEDPSFAFAHLGWWVDADFHYIRHVKG